MRRLVAMPEVYHTSPTTKKCAHCEQEKFLDSFHKMKASLDGLRPTCKKCRKEMDKAPRVIVQIPLFIFSKFCSVCQEEKPIEEFNLGRSKKSCYNTFCRKCQSEYNHQHRIDHHEEYRERDHIKVTSSNARIRTMKRHRERSVTDPLYLEQLKQRRHRHYQSHKDQAKDYYPRRKARILNATVGKVSYEQILERDGYVCHICQKPIDPKAKGRASKSLSFDHVIPLKPRPGEPQGTHSEDNLKPAHLSCNVRKGNRP